MKDIISAKQLGKNYGDLTVLKGIDLSIKKGEVVAITGPSGAGKTTLLQILGTLTRPEVSMETSLVIEKTKVLELNDRALARFRNESLGFIFQFHELLDEFTALENVMMPALIQGKSKTAIKARAMELLERLGVDHRMDHKPNSLSGGEQQRIAVARALMNDPAIILLMNPVETLTRKMPHHSINYSLICVMNSNKPLSSLPTIKLWLVWQIAPLT